MGKVTSWIETSDNIESNVSNNESLTKILFSYQDPERKTKVLEQDKNDEKIVKFDKTKELKKEKDNTIKFSKTSELSKQNKGKNDKLDTKTLEVLEENSCKTCIFQPSTKEFKEMKMKETVEEEVANNVRIKEVSNVDQEIKKQKQNYQSKIPSFIKLESRFTFISFLFSALLFLSGIAAVAAVAYCYLSLNQSVYLFIPAGIYFVCTLACFGVTSSRYRFFKKEIKASGEFFDKENPLMSIKRVYKRLVLANFNLNWFSCLVYLWALLGILMTILIAYFINLFQFTINEFGLLYINNDATPYITVWSLASICFVMFPLQIILNIANRNRKFAIETYYQKEIISLDLQHQYKKSAKWKWIVILVTSIIFLTLPVVITYFVLKRKASSPLKLLA